VVSVADALERDLEAFPDGVAESALAAQARAIAFRLDHEDTPSYAVAGLSKELRECLEDLRKQAPPKKANDSVDDISAAYAKRRRRTGTKG
jgi:hypothetical protein